MVSIDEQAYYRTENGSRLVHGLEVEGGACHPV